MSLAYCYDVYYHDCYHGDILVCFIDRHYHTFTLAQYHNFTSIFFMALLSYNGVKVSPSEIMLRIITSLVLL